MADDEEDDPVVAEVDVYLAQALAENLYLFQYPIRPADITYDNIPHMGARIKPEQQKVEVELSINTNSSNYYVPRGEQIAHDVDASAPGLASGESFFTSNLMDKQVLTSSLAAEDVGCYTVGILRQGELHLTPLHGALQLRPSFEYLNKGEANTRQNASLTEEGDSQDEEDEAKAVTVKFARPETEKAKAQRLSSFKYLEKKKAEEPWTNVQFFNPQDRAAETELGLLFCRELELYSPEFQVNSRDYLKLLTPSDSKEESSKPHLPNNVLSMTQLKTMDLQDQVKALLINAKVISFSQLCRLLSPPTKEATVLKCVQQYAVLVQGCWVVKSELLYPEGSISPNSGIAADILCKGRDYLMWRFNQNRVVVRKDIKSVTKLPSEDIKEMLDQMSRMKVAMGWEFFLPNDVEFIQKHPDVYKQQQALWEAKYQVLQKQLNMPKQEKPGIDSKKISNADAISSTENKKASKSTKSKANKVLSNDRLHDGLLTDEEHSPMEVDCKEVIHNEHNHEITKESLSVNNEHYSDSRTILQEFVKEKLHRTVLSFADFKKLLLLRQTASGPGDPLCSGVPDVLLEKAILGAGATEIDFKWPPGALSIDSQARRLFAFRSTGDSSDEYRALLLDMFSKACRLTRKDFNTRAAQLNLAEPSRKDWMTVQQDLLERYGNRHVHWFLRGTSTIVAENL
ncbi:DNA-directed RNA polymerase III subunit RPC5-like isoform X1 [Montipora foliosa]|uniref:DNA-directed RNA polymerase III subunit RPC5-like isoform X1 n=1 Tax=Montipora foliosa TaxID=591990 RepID=UPI0035F10A8B